MRVCIVTGGGRGIGRAICERMSRDGYTVVVNYRSSIDGATAVCRAIAEEGGEAWPYAADVTDYEAVRGMVRTVVSTHGRIDLLVNNAGEAVEGLFALTPPERFLEQININLRGVVLCSHFALPIMLRQKSGVIINITSASSLRGPLGLGAYSSAKAAINCLTQSIAREVAGSGIRVNAIAPSWIDTEMIAKRRERVANEVRKYPLARFGTADEVAAAVSAVAKDDMSYFLGQILLLNGGA